MNGYLLTRMTRRAVRIGPFVPTGAASPACGTREKTEKMEPREKVMGGLTADGPGNGADD
jgi:hypothetical protein